VLGLPDNTTRFSIFEPISDALLKTINKHDYLIVTGCTTLQDDEGHQRCFDAQFDRISIPKLCFAGTFFCEPEEHPSLRIARLYGTPIAVRDPWAYEYLRTNDIDCTLVGCPTILEGSNREDWRSGDQGPILISSTPPIDLDLSEITSQIRYIAHDAKSPGEDILDPELFEGVSLVITARLHAALPAIARGIPVRFFSPRLFGTLDYGSNRYSLLEYLGIPLDGKAPKKYPREQIHQLKNNCLAWLNSVLGT
jgi:polysaccharide pyruvyl transferase WcaK-like protein